MPRRRGCFPNRFGNARGCPSTSIGHDGPSRRFVGPGGPAIRSSRAAPERSRRGGGPGGRSPEPGIRRPRIRRSSSPPFGAGGKVVALPAVAATASCPIPGSAPFGPSRFACRKEPGHFRTVPFHRDTICRIPGDPPVEMVIGSPEPPVFPLHPLRRTAAVRQAPDLRPGCGRRSVGGAEHLVPASCCLHWRLTVHSMPGAAETHVHAAEDGVPADSGVAGVSGSKCRHFPSIRSFRTGTCCRSATFTEIVAAETPSGPPAPQIRFRIRPVRIKGGRERDRRV